MQRHGEHLTDQDIFRKDKFQIHRTFSFKSIIQYHSYQYQYGNITIKSSPGIPSNRRWGRIFLVESKSSVRPSFLLKSKIYYCRWENLETKFWRCIETDHQPLVGAYIGSQQPSASPVNADGLEHETKKNNYTTSMKTESRNDANFVVTGVTGDDKVGIITIQCCNEESSPLPLHSSRFVPVSSLWSRERTWPFYYPWKTHQEQLPE